METISRLLTASSGALGPSLDRTRTVDLLSRWGESGRDLAELLSMRNGFYGYDRALLVRPLTSSTPPLGLMEWNQAALWRDSYGPEFNLGDALFFAEDAFGEQYCLSAAGVCRFNPESGALLDVSPRLSGWLRLVVDEPDVVTAFPMLQQWEVSHERLRPGQRLVPLTPFVQDGAYDPSNLRVETDATAMTQRAELANRLWSGAQPPSRTTKES